jgi:hypothetical protein
MTHPGGGNAAQKWLPKSAQNGACNTLILDLRDRAQRENGVPFWHNGSSAPPVTAPDTGEHTHAREKSLNFFAFHGCYLPRYLFVG